MEFRAAVGEARPVATHGDLEVKAGATRSLRDGKQASRPRGQEATQDREAAGDAVTARCELGAAETQQRQDVDENELDPLIRRATAHEPARSLLELGPVPSPEPRGAVAVRLDEWALELDPLDGLVVAHR